VCRERFRLRDILHELGKVKHFFRQHFGHQQYDRLTSPRTIFLDFCDYAVHFVCQCKHLPGIIAKLPGLFDPYFIEVISYVVRVRDRRHVWRLLFHVFAQFLCKENQRVCLSEKPVSGRIVCAHSVAVGEPFPSTLVKQRERLGVKWA